MTRLAVFFSFAASVLLIAQRLCGAPPWYALQWEISARRRVPALKEQRALPRSPTGISWSVARPRRTTTNGVLRRLSTTPRRRQRSLAHFLIRPTGRLKRPPSEPHLWRLRYWRSAPSSYSRDNRFLALFGTRIPIV
jgi:hypothetical protein